MADIVLKNANGENITYSGITSLKLKDENNEDVIFNVKSSGWTLTFNSISMPYGGTIKIYDCEGQGSPATLLKTITSATTEPITVMSSYSIENLRYIYLEWTGSSATLPFITRTSMTNCSLDGSSSTYNVYKLSADNAIVTGLSMEDID